MDRNDELLKFDRALADPTAAQDEVRRRILDDNRDTSYGRATGFAGANSYAAFASSLPITSYEEIEPYMLRMIEGEPSVLVAAPVLYFGVSSGTTGGKKYVPIHAGFGPETELWMALERELLRRAHPGFELLPEMRYVNRVEGTVPCGLPCGAVSAWYYGELYRQHRYTELVPFEVFQLGSVDARNYAVLRFAIMHAIGRITAVNPSTLLLLSRTLAASSNDLVRDVRDGDVSHPDLPAQIRAALRTRLRPDPDRASQLEDAAARDGRLAPPRVWPSLQLVSCWMHAGASLYTNDLNQAFGPLPQWDYGYTSTEGRVTVTVDDTGAGVPLLTSTFFELRDESGVVRPLTSAEPGDQGEMIVTNSRGLYRYQTGDIVSIVGRLERAPLLKYERKLRATASLTGEKLTEAHVLPAVRAALERAGVHAEYSCLCARWGAPPQYVLALEVRGAQPGSDLERQIADDVERSLVSSNNEYEKKRETHRLGPVSVQVLSPGSRQAYLDAEIAKGREAARIKMPTLTMDLEFLKRLAPNRS